MEYFNNICLFSIYFSEFHPAGLTWNVSPLVSAKEGEVIPDFSIKSSPGVKTQLKLTGPEG